MPQLDSTTFPSQLFWLSICFLILYFIIRYIFLPKITKVLENRETLREQKLNEASTYRAHAEDLLTDYERTLAEAREKAHQVYQQSVSLTAQEMNQKKKDSRDKLQERLHIAEQELYRARLEASGDVALIAQEVAGKILEKVTAGLDTPSQLDKGKE